MLGSLAKYWWARWLLRPSTRKWCLHAESLRSLQEVKQLNTFAWLLNDDQVKVIEDKTVKFLSGQPAEAQKVTVAASSSCSHASNSKSSSSKPSAKRAVKKKPESAVAEKTWLEGFFS